MLASPSQEFQLLRFSQAMCPAKVSKSLIAAPADRGETPQQAWHFATAVWLQRVRLDESYGAMPLAWLWLGKVNVAQATCTIAGSPNAHVAPPAAEPEGTRRSSLPIDPDYNVLVKIGTRQTVGCARR